MQINGIPLLQIPALLPAPDYTLPRIWLFAALVISVQLSLTWAERGISRAALGTHVSTHPPAISQHSANSPCPQGWCRPALAKLGQAGCSPSQSSHLQTHPCQIFSPFPTTKQAFSAEFGPYIVLMYCYDSSIHCGTILANQIRKMNEHAAFCESQVYTGQKTPDRTSLFSALTILSEISCPSRNWTATAEAIFVYFSKLCFSNINVKKLKIMGFKTPEFHSILFSIMILKLGSVWTQYCSYRRK